MATRNVINPHDAITISYEDIDAARIALLVVGNGAYCIEGDDMPILRFGGGEEWCQKTYGKTMSEWFDTVSRERICTALESMALVGKRSSTTDPVGHAHELAESMRKTLATQQGGPQ